MRLSPKMVPPKPEGAPPSIWAVWVKQTSSWVTGGDWLTILEAYHQHLLSNHVPVPANLSEHLQDLICQQCPPSWPGCKLEGQKRVLGMEDLKRWAVSMLGLFGSRYAEQEEAERRAKICAGCRYQTELSGFCSHCSGIPTMLMKLVSGRTTSVDSQLKSCQFCGCRNEIAVHFPLDVLQKASAGIEYPEDTRLDGKEPVPCWKVDQH